MKILISGRALPGRGLAAPASKRPRRHGDRQGAGLQRDLGLVFPLLATRSTPAPNRRAESGVPPFDGGRAPLVLRLRPHGRDPVDAGRGPQVGGLHRCAARRAPGNRASFASLDEPEFLRGYGSPRRSWGAKGHVTNQGRSPSVGPFAFTPSPGCPAIDPSWSLKRVRLEVKRSRGFRLAT